MRNSEKFEPGAWVRNVVARSVSRLSHGLPWFDTHLALIPVPTRSERPALPQQRSIMAAYRAERTV